MPESLGVRLRAQRERQQISLSKITDQTKIKTSLLEALERDDVSVWPTGLFRRAYIRAYAQAIGLEPDSVLREFLDLHPDPAEAVAPVSEAATDHEHTASRPPMRLRYVIKSALASFSRRLSDTPSQISVGPQPAIPRRHIPVASEAVLDAEVLGAARLCTAFGAVSTLDEATPLLRDVARLLSAIGLIVWVWDGEIGRLKPALAHGYSRDVLAHVPPLPPDSDTATAAAFRLAQACTVKGRDLVSGALVVPLMSASGSIGVLAIELPPGNEQTASVRAIATIFASHLARLVAAAYPMEVADRRLA
jgi:transcriptional regulator with XRE-family HTH domain